MAELYKQGETFYPFWNEPGTHIASVGMMIVRDDGFYYDFNDTTYKDSAWTTKETALTEKTDGMWILAAGYTLPAADRRYNIRFRAVDDVSDIIFYDGPVLQVGSAGVGNLDSALSTMQGNVTDILADTDDLQTSQGNWTTATGFATSTALSTHDGKLDDAMGATFATATDSLEALRDRGDSAWTTGAGGTPPQLLQSTTIATLTSQTVFTLTAGSADNNAYDGAVVIVTDQTTSTQKAVGSVSGYVGSTKQVTLVSDPGIFTMAVGDTIDVLAAISNAPTVAQIRTEMDSNSTKLIDIVADTNELQSNQGNWTTAVGFSTHSAADVWTTGGRALTDKVDFALSTSDKDALVVLVWDRVITAANHNISNSAARKLRNLGVAGYSLGSIWVDTVNGTAGTEPYENGTTDTPSNTIADATTLAGLVGLVRFEIAPGSAISFAQTYTSYLFTGKGWSLALASQQLNNCHIIGATVSGIATTLTEVEFYACEMDGCTLGPSHLYGCALEGTIVAGALGEFKMEFCHSGVAGITTPVFDFGGAVGATDLSMRHYSGGIEIQNMAATDKMSLEGNGQLIINANCTGGELVVRGNFTVTDNSGNVTLYESARLDTQQVRDALKLAPTAGAPAAGSIDADLDTITGADGVTLASLQGNYAPLRGDIAMTESYAVDGATATPQEMFYMIWSLLSDFNIVGTTYTSKKLDGSTTAMTFTLNDGTTPTAMFRAA